MKALRIARLEEAESVICPYCKAEGKTEALEHYSSRNYKENNTEWRFFQSIKRFNQFHKTGIFCICNHCNELFFVFIESDTRICSQCKHHSRPSSSFKCEWFNREFDCFREHAYHCEHINEEPKTYSYQTICQICANYKYKKDNYQSGYICNATKPYDLKRDISLKPDFSCHSFAPGYEQYKEYRKQFQESLFDEGIHIPEFDEMIEKENKNGIY